MAILIIRPERVDEGKKSAEPFSRQKCKARTVVGRREKSFDPGSELRLGGSRTRKANAINGMEKIKAKIKIAVYCSYVCVKYARIPQFAV